MDRKLLKRRACKVWILFPVMICCLLTANSLRAATFTINKTTSTITTPTYSSGDLLVISGNSLEAADWNVLKALTTGYHLDLQTANANIPGNAFWGCSGLLSVTSSAITTIESSAFYNCTALTKASFSNATTIGESAFYNCTVLTEASFPKAETIGNNAFYNCTVLTEASFSNAGTIGNYAFYNCDALTNVSFPNATTIGTRAFEACNALTKASFPNATTIGNYAFYNCPELINASLPNATTIGSWAFGYSDKMLCLTLGGTPPALDGPYVFYNVPPLLLIVPDSTVYTPLPAGFPYGSEAFNKSVPTQQGIIAPGTPYNLIPNRIPTLTGGYFRWEKDGVVIPGATGTTYQATTPGLYTLQYYRGGGFVTLLSIRLVAMSYSMNNRYQGCENVLQLTFTRSTAERTIEVWSEGTGAGSLYDLGSGEYFKNTLTYKLAAGDSVLTIYYAVDDSVKDGSQATFAYQVAPGGTTERTDEFTLYATPEIKLIAYYPTTAQFKGVLDISITNGSYYIQGSLDGGETWQFVRDTITGEMLPFSQSRIAGFSWGRTILFRMPGGCSYETLTVGNNEEDDPSIIRKVTMPYVSDAICSVAYGVYMVNSGDNFSFTITPTGSNAGKTPQVSTSRT